MTKFTEEDIANMKDVAIGKVVSNLYYDKEDDYYVMEFEDSSELAFRLMADLFNN